MDYQGLAQQVLAGVGGKSNISKVWHCATRLRFYLNDEKKADTKKIDALAGVITVVQSAGQYQVVIGNSVAKVYDALVDLAGLENTDEQPAVPAEAANKPNLINRFIGFISGVFLPFLGALAGAGILKGFLALFVALGWMTEKSGQYQIWYAAGAAIFYAFPVFLGFTAAKQLKVNQFVGASIGAALLYPSLVAAFAKGTTMHFFGIPVVPTTYTTTVIPILLSIWALSYIEPLLKKLMPEAIRNVFVPMLSLMIMVPLTLIVVGPIGALIGNALATGVMAVYHFAPIIAGIIMGAFWQVFVIFGVHWTFMPLIMNNFTKLGYDPLTPIICAAVLSQAGAAFGVFMKSRNKKMKSLAGSSALSGLFGITEPAIYGVTLKLKKPFYIAVASGAVGGAIISISGVHASSFTMPSLLSLPTFLDHGFMGEIIGLTVATVGAAMITYFFGVPDDQSSEQLKNENQPKNSNGTDEIKAPVEGTIIPLTSVKDEVFASEAMGKGLAIVPSNDEVVAPANGTISAVYPTGHALGMIDDSGAEILIHIGINTVELKGKYFKTLVKQNEHVTAGQPLVKFDREKIAAAGYDTTVMVIITNTNHYGAVEPTAATETDHNWFLKLAPKPAAAANTKGVPANV
ncbi:beta-glucosides PTS, EIIBCA [Lactobacillus selangorensis]|uniref:PTS system sucrose-specific EIIBCA component n=1 Tax=Lactobacillus selangorensis TaxID=81857 RepID=A0A0R2FSQ9_9LACO|nr:beta-glucoside-specific PTS transporter subunit IIABC [Lactobacillus selangorensis]KRN28156.1 beta-glucosides PTS, EIIBCA [Lactobacillus selangorensis]KRN30968.1 beta-glucosides PTS, EIIBCA [Lactobacillus selangorensis]